MQHDDPLLRPREAAEYLRVSADHLAQLRYRGQGPAYLKPSPKVVLYRRSALDTWLNASEQSGTVGRGVA